MLKSFNFGKSIVAFLLILSSSVTPLFAVDLDANSDNFVSEEVFTETLEKEFEKHGVTVDIDVSEASVPLTKQLLEIELEKVEEMSDFQIISGERKVSIAPKPVTNDVGVTPYVMPMDFYYTNSFMVVWNDFPRYGDAEFDCAMSGEIDIQSANIMSVAYFDVGHVKSINMDDYDLTTDYSIRNHGEIMVYVSGTVDFAYTNPETNIVYKASKVGPFFVDTFNANDYTY